MISIKREYLVAVAALAVTGTLFLDDVKAFAADAQIDTAVMETVETETSAEETAEDVTEQTTEETAAPQEETAESGEAKTEATEEVQPESQEPAENTAEETPEVKAEDTPELAEAMPSQEEWNQMLWASIPSMTHDLPVYSGMKSYESYRALGRGAQRRLQGMATTDADGFRKVDDRYLIAIGTRFGARTGQYVDLKLENGTEINCIVGDIKANAHTDSSNTFSANNCASEFIVDTSMIKNVVRGGDVSSYRSEWKSPVDTITVYEKYVF